MSLYARVIVVVHGRSDFADSFLALSSFVVEWLQRTVGDLWLGDWVSMDDRVTYREVGPEAFRLRKASETAAG